ncbi:zinc-dependent alcohol dehydrogenase family protein [Aspergillus clavatus NRRL 1]|uniref:Alcohol dehydrogenase, zinc-containing n=1 Tax=Aspergillus clavatus (strain ATCC 1007 / CBS 513.65 / DSM 816 / NCTC 3887 / NRRL 1 / QM 1276 / 107) TaxID=344612 RepID=A1CFT1_ASPCL|nr:alcohol dehydrogenase, zinc-containing [Aspergillus clavatus NRRL 1]EAW11730.1 alcohol dehydrogenase, zinc-containing [Aspergillus clavatus NRRL 1]
MAPIIKQWKSNLQGFDSLHQAEAPMPTPGKGEVLVEIHAVSLNYRDTEVVQGEYNHHKATDGIETVVVPCSDMSGVVTQVGDGVTTWKVGDRVLSTFLPDHQTGQVTEKELGGSLGLPVDGVLATHRVFPERALVRAPAHMMHEEGSTLPIASVTAWMSINGMRPMGQNGGQGEYVLLLGTGGVSIAGLQIAKASGAKVIITSSSDEKLEQARKLGADYTINYRTQPDWDKEVMRVTNNHGADIILETGGSDTLSKTFDCAAFGGLIDCIGYTSGKQHNPNDRLNMNVLTLRKDLTIKGIINGPKDRFEEMVQFYEKHQIHPVVNRVFPFEEARAAFQFLASGAHFGKVVVKVKDP